MAKILKEISMTTLAGLALVSCTQSPPPDGFAQLMDTTGKWAMSEEEKAKYAKLEVNQARSRFVNDRFQNTIATMQTDTERQELAAAIYINFAMLQAHAIPAYCQGMNVDISNYQTAYAASNRRAETGLAKVLAARGTSFDEVYARYADKLRTTAKYELMSSGSSYSACTTVRDDPQKMARLTKFSSFYPRIEAYLAK